MVARFPIRNIHIILFYAILFLFTPLTQDQWIIALALSFFCYISFDIYYHRYCSHKSFEIGPFSEDMLQLFCFPLGFRSAIDVVTYHRYHHKYSDTPKDPLWPTGAPLWKVIIQHPDLQAEVNRTEMIRMSRDIIRHPKHSFVHKYSYTTLAICLAVLAVWDYTWISVFFGIPALISFLIITFGGAILQHCQGRPLESRALDILSLGLLVNHKHHHDDSTDPRHGTFDLIYPFIWWIREPYSYNNR